LKKTSLSLALDESARISTLSLIIYGSSVTLAILIVGILAINGVFTPEPGFQGKCFVKAPFGCSEFGVNKDGVRIKLINGAGSAVDINKINISGCGENTDGWKNISDGEIVDIFVSCPAGKRGEKFDGNVEITYTLSGDDVEKIVSGEIESEITNIAGGGGGGGGGSSGGGSGGSPPLSVCGNNLIESGEVCDDGNTLNGDGCSSVCILDMPATTGRLVSHWKFEGDYRDSIGINHGIPNGDIIIKNDITRGNVSMSYYDFAYVGIDFIQNLPASNFSFSLWFYLTSNATSTGPDSRYLLKSDGWGLYQGAEDEFVDDFIYFSSPEVGGDEDYLPITDAQSIGWRPLVGVWNHIACSIVDNESVRCYANNVEQTLSSDFAGYIGETSSLNISGLRDSNSYQSYFDDVMIFNKSLSSEEISDIYNSQIVGNCVVLENPETSCYDILDNDCDYFYDYKEDNCHFGVPSLRSNNVLYFPFENSPGFLLDFFDMSGTFYSDGQNNGNAYLAYDLFRGNNVLLLDGAGDFAHFSTWPYSTLNFSGLNSFSYGAWFKASQITSQGGILTKSSLSDNSYTLQAGTLQNISCGNGMGNFVSSNSVPLADSWYHAMCIHNGTHMHLYVDGVLQDDVVSMSFSGSSTNTVEIGRLNVGQASNYFNGSIDEVVVFNKALNQAEIDSIIALG